MNERKQVNRMWNRVETLGSIVQQITQEMNNLRDLSIGTMSLIKKLPDYDEAIKALAEDIKKEEKEETNVE